MIAGLRSTRTRETVSWPVALSNVGTSSYSTADLLAARIRDRVQWDARAVVLGHLQRAGKPLAFDRIFALRLGARAARLVLEKKFGRMSAMQAGEIADVSLASAVAERRVLTSAFLDKYESFFLPIGEL